MDIKPAEITDILRREIKDYDREIDVAETGTVLSIGDGIARVYALETVMAGALVEFPESAVPRFRHGAEIQLVIEHGEISARVAATVRRVDGPRIAFTFPGALRGAAIVAPEGLDEILRRLRTPSLGTASTLTA